MYLSVIIPAYNEEKRIGKTLLAVDKYLQSQNYEYEIVVVNDGSIDNTLAIISNSKFKIQNLRVLNNSQNRGKGYVVRQALAAAKGEWRLFTDADNATPIEELEKLLNFSQQAKVIIASRSALHANILAPQPWYRQLLGKLYSFLAFSLAGFSGIKDTQCGFKLFHHEAVKDILPHCTIDGLSFDVEMLLVAQKKGHTIKEAAVTWVNDKDSKVTITRMAKAIFELATIRKNTILGQYGKSWEARFLKFCVVGFLGFCVDIIFLRLFRSTGMFEFLSWALAAECAIISNYVFNNLWTFRETSIKGLKKTVAKFLQFNGTSAGAIVIQSTLGTLGVMALGIQYDIFILIFTIIFFIVPYNYLMYTRFIWKSTQ